MVSRRKFIQASALMTSGLLLNNNSSFAQKPKQANHWFMPEESDPHQRTWMSFIASYDIWEDRQVPEVQRNLAEIAKTIAKYEAVTLLVRQQDYDLAIDLLDGLDTHKYPIELIVFKMNDLWMRDTGPSFVITESGNKAGVNSSRKRNSISAEEYLIWCPSP